MSIETDRLNAEAIAKGRTAAGIETTRPLAEDIRAQSSTTDSVLIGLQGAVLDLQKRLYVQEKETDSIKNRIRKIC